MGGKAINFKGRAVLPLGLALCSPLDYNYTTYIKGWVRDSPPESGDTSAGIISGTSIGNQVRMKRFSGGTFLYLKVPEWDQNYQGNKVVTHRWHTTPASPPLDAWGPGWNSAPALPCFSWGPRVVSEWWFNAVSATEAIFTARTC